MKKTLCILLALTVLLLACCKAEEDRVITGDVKDKEISESVDAVKVDDPKENNISETEITDENEENIIDGSLSFVKKNIANLGCKESDGGEYYEDAVILCEAVKCGDKETFSQYTLGKSEYYDFLDKVKISSYTIYPVEFADETLSAMEEKAVYPAAGDNYLVMFDVSESSCDEFKVGENLYWIGLDMEDAVAGNKLYGFMPVEKARECMTVSYGDDYAGHFIDELSSLYFRDDRVFDGRNYPDTFDFSDSAHLITHLMARSSVYGDPPYTLGEVNEFITSSFDGNKGLKIPEMDLFSWTSAGTVYESDDPERIYGCSWGHGGTSAEHRIVSVQDDGNSCVYSVEYFADYSQVALAKCADFYFDKLENGLLRLTLVNIYNDSGREIALVSV